MSTKDLLDEVLRTPSVFKDKFKLSPDFVPSKLPHRENKIKELGIAFRELITDPGKSSIRVVVTGRTGTGKTATTRLFGDEFKDLARSRGIRLEYIHLNCHKERTLFMLVNEISNQLKLPIPTRGLSSQEIFRLINDFLSRRNTFLIVTFDEFDYFIDSSPFEDIYFLARVYDEIPSPILRINYIFILRDLTKLRSLDPVVRDHILRHVIEFPPYTANELYDILKERVNMAFYSNVVLDDVLLYISEIHGYDKGGTGNARAAIETLELAGEIADKYGSPIVTIDHAKEANSRLNPHMSEIIDNIKYLDLHLLLLIKSIINMIKREKTEYITMGELEEEYNKISQELGERPRRHTQIYEYVRRLRQLGIFNTSQSGKGMRGRTTLIALSVPLNIEFEELIDREIRGRILSKI